MDECEALDKSNIEVAMDDTSFETSPAEIAAAFDIITFYRVDKDYLYIIKGQMGK